MLLDNNKKTKQPENEKQTFFEKLYWVVFQFFVKIHAIMHDKIILFDAALLVQKTTMLLDYAAQSIKYYDLTNL